MFTASGSTASEPKYQKNICTSSGVLRKNSVKPALNQTSGRTLVIRNTAMMVPSSRASRMDTAEIFKVVMRPWMIHSPYSPERTSFQSNL